MPQNLVRSHRTASGLTQRELAKRVGTSHQQIQAIESYDKPLQLDLAIKICTELGQPIDEVFPSMDPAAWIGLLASDHTVETLRCRMRGGHTLDIHMDAAEAGRLQQAMPCVSSDDGFILIDSIDSCRYAINPLHLLVWQWGWQDRPELAAVDPSLTGVRLWLVDGGDPLDYAVAEDTPRLDDEYVGQLWDLFTCLEDSEPQPRHLDRLDFVDQSGERVCFHKADAVVVAAPLALIGSEEGMPWDTTARHPCKAPSLSVTPTAPLCLPAPTGRRDPAP